MSAKKTGLGDSGNMDERLAVLGLNRKNSDGKPVRGGIREIPLAAITANPQQARRVFREEALQSLAASIKAYGIVQPLVVREKGGGRYELIAGERRLRAAALCGLKTVPALVRTDGDDVSAIVSLVENVQRENLDAIEEGAAYRMLIDTCGLTQAEVSEKVGKSRSHVANLMRLLKLAVPVQQHVSEGRLTMGQVRPLLQINDEEKQCEIAGQIIALGLSARQAEALVRRLLEKKETVPEKEDPDPYVEALQDRLKMHLGTVVAIRFPKGKGKGKIEISFASEDEFERLLSVLTDTEKRREDVQKVSFHI